MSQRVQCTVKTNEWHAESMQINMQINVLILQGPIRHSVMAEWHTHTNSHTLPIQRIVITRPSAGPWGGAIGRSSAGRQTGSGQSSAGSQLRLPLVLWGRVEWKQTG